MFFVTCCAFVCSSVFMGRLVSLNWAVLCLPVGGGITVAESRASVHGACRLVAEQDRHDAGMLAERLDHTCDFWFTSRHPFTGPPPFSPIALPLLHTSVHSMYCSTWLSLGLLLSFLHLFFVYFYHCLLPPCHGLLSLASSLTCLTHFVVYVPLWVHLVVVCLTLVRRYTCRSRSGSRPAAATLHCHWVMAAGHGAIEQD